MPRTKRHFLGKPTILMNGNDPTLYDSLYCSVCGKMNCAFDCPGNPTVRARGRRSDGAR